MAEITCPKCAREYYGVGCPYCDYPPVPEDKGLPARRLLFGLIAIVAGLYPIGLYFFNRSLHRPEVFVAGLTFVLAGVQLISVQRFYDENGRASAVVSVLFLLSFAFICFFGAFSSRAHWSGLPLVPKAVNDWVGRILSGLIGVGMSAWALKVFYLMLKAKNKK